MNKSGEHEFESQFKHLLIELYLSFNQTRHCH